MHRTTGNNFEDGYLVVVIYGSGGEILGILNRIFGRQVDIFS